MQPRVGFCEAARRRQLHARPCERPAGDVAGAACAPRRCRIERQSERTAANVQLMQAAQLRVG
eukprot:248961-Chlamydomonas_euryale.AAC.1